MKTTFPSRFFLSDRTTENEPEAYFNSVFPPSDFSKPAFYFHVYNLRSLSDLKKDLSSILLSPDPLIYTFIKSRPIIPN